MAASRQDVTRTFDRTSVQPSPRNRARSKASSESPHELHVLLRHRLLRQPHGFEGLGVVGVAAPLAPTMPSLKRPDNRYRHDLNRNAASPARSSTIRDSHGDAVAPPRPHEAAVPPAASALPDARPRWLCTLQLAVEVPAYVLRRQRRSSCTRRRDRSRRKPRVGSSALKASIQRRTISTFSCDIAYA